MRRHPLRSPETGARDAALRRLGVLNRCLIAGSLTLTGVLAEAAAHTFPGKTVRTADKRHDGRRHGAGAAASKSTAAPLRAPAQPPRAVNTQTTTTQPTETSPAHETTTTPQSTQKAEPAQETAPAHETVPTPEPAQESTPLVSGGS
jgi:hypothetical protein